MGRASVEQVFVNPKQNCQPTMISQLIRQPNVWLVNQHCFVNQNEIADCFSCLMGVLVAESVCQIEESSYM